MEDQKLPAQPQRRTAPFYTAAAETSVRGGNRVMEIGDVHRSGKSATNPTSTTEGQIAAARSSWPVTASALASGNKSQSQTPLELSTTVPPSLASLKAVVANAAAVTSARRQPILPSTLTAAPPSGEAAVTKQSSVAVAGLSATAGSSASGSAFVPIRAAAVPPAASLPTSIAPLAIGKSLLQSVTAPKQVPTTTTMSAMRAGAPTASAGSAAQASTTRTSADTTGFTGAVGLSPSLHRTMATASAASTSVTAAMNGAASTSDIPNGKPPPKTVGIATNSAVAPTKPMALATSTAAASTTASTMSTMAAHAPPLVTFLQRQTETTKVDAAAAKTTGLVDDAKPKAVTKTTSTTTAKAQAASSKYTASSASTNSSSTTARKDPPSGQPPARHEKARLTIQTQSATASAAFAAAAAAAAPTFQHEVQLNKEPDDDKDDDDVAVVIQVQSTQITVSVNASGSHVKVVDTQLSNGDPVPIFEETLVYKSTSRKRPIPTSGDSQLAAASADHENVAEQPAKRQRTAAATSATMAPPLTLWTPKPNAQPVNSKLLVNCSDTTLLGEEVDKENDDDAMDNLPGTALYRATLEHYRPAFCATAATLDEKEAIVQRFLDCFMFQNPVVNEDSMREDGTTTQSTDWLVLGAHSARTMLYEALSQPVSSMSSTTRTSRSKPVPYNAHAAKTAAPGLTIKSSAATSTGSATTATSRTKRLPAMKKVPDGMSSCSGDSDDSDSDDASFVPTKPSRFATRTATAAANKTKPTNAHRRPVVYCYKGSHYSKVAANVAFVELIRSHIREYLNASEGRQEAIIDDIADRFEFALGPDANGPWKCPTEEWIRNKIYNSLTRTKPPENTVSTPKSRQLRSSPQKSPTKATREKASMSRVAQMTTLNKNTAAAAAAPTKALSMETLNRIAASTGKLVVYCGFAGPGYSGEPGNAAYVERMHETHGEYCSAASNVTKKEAIVDAILDEFDFYRPINASLTLWTKADAAWTRRKVSRRLTLLGTEVATAATRASTMDE